MASINRRDLVKVVRAKLVWDSVVPWTKLNVCDPNYFLPFLHSQPTVDAACKGMARDICMDHKGFNKMGLVGGLEARAKCQSP